MNVPQTGRYAFHMMADADSKVTIDGRVVLQAHHVAAKDDAEPMVELAAGLHVIRADLTNAYGVDDVRFMLLWKQDNGFDLRAIPTTSLFHVAAEGERAAATTRPSAAPRALPAVAPNPAAPVAGSPVTPGVATGTSDPFEAAAARLKQFAFDPEAVGYFRAAKFAEVLPRLSALPQEEQLRCLLCLMVLRGDPPEVAKLLPNYPGSMLAKVAGETYWPMKLEIPPEEGAYVWTIRTALPDKDGLVTSVIQFSVTDPAREKDRWVHFYRWTNVSRLVGDKTHIGTLTPVGGDAGTRCAAYDSSRGTVTPGTPRFPAAGAERTFDLTPTGDHARTDPALYGTPPAASAAVAAAPCAPRPAAPAGPAAARLPARGRSRPRPTTWSPRRGRRPARSSRPTTPTAARPYNRRWSAS